jgi:hypothetical protein
MTLAIDAVSVHASQSTSYSSTHTPVGTPIAVIVVIGTLVSTPPSHSELSYGGRALRPIGWCASNLGDSLIYVLDHDVPSGAQSIAWKSSAPAQWRKAAVITLTGSGSSVSVVADSGIQSSGTAQNPSQAVDRGASSAMAFLVSNHGENTEANVSAGANTTEDAVIGTAGSHQTFIGHSAEGTGSVTLNYNTSASDTYSQIGFALIEDTQEDAPYVAKFSVHTGAQSADPLDISVTVPSDCVGMLVTVMPSTVGATAEAETGVEMAGLDFTAEVTQASRWHSRIYSLLDIEGNTGSQTVTVARDNSSGVRVNIYYLGSSSGLLEKVGTTTYAASSSHPELTLDPDGDKTIIFAVGTTGSWQQADQWPETGVDDDSGHAPDWYWDPEVSWYSGYGCRWGPKDTDTTHGFYMNQSNYCYMSAIGLKAGSQDFLTADAIVEKGQSASLTADAILGTLFDIDALILAAKSGTLGLDAVLFGTEEGEFDADAYIGVPSATFPIDAILKRTLAASLLLDATTQSVPSSAPTSSLVTIEVGGQDISADVVYAQTQFTSSASAQPGNANIVVRDLDEVYAFQEGSEIVLKVKQDGTTRRMWRGYLFDVERGYIHEDDETKRGWTLSGVDLNILLDKLILYNHVNPTRYPDGGGTYKRRRIIEGGQTAGYQVSVPRYTYDGDYIRAMLNDFDIDKVYPVLKTGRIESVGMINPDGAFTPPMAGTTLRDFLINTAANVNRSQPGSVIFYVDPDANIIYMSQDRDNAPFWVGDENPLNYIGGVQGENVKGLRVRKGISNIKNDVLIFAGELDPSPGSRQKLLRYKHRKNQSSIDTYGRFQFSETVKGSWQQAAVNARANKIINQEGTPGQTAEFTLYRGGLYPGQIVWVTSVAHGVTTNVPIRQITMSFPLPDIVEYRASCSFDSQDPWGLLLALRRPPSRGLRQPNFTVIDLRRNPDQTLPPAERYSLVKEYPQSLGGSKYRTSYAYIRDSMVVYVGKLRQVSIQDPESGTSAFQQTSPSEGRFKLADPVTGGKRVYVEYHVARDL